MNVYTTIVKTTDLKERLEREGRYWYVKEIVKGWGVLGTLHTAELTLEVYRKCWDWGVIPTRKEVQELLKPLVLEILETARLSAENRYVIGVYAKALYRVETTHDIGVISALGAAAHFKRYALETAVNLDITDQQAFDAWNFREGWYAQAIEEKIDYKGETE